MNDPTLDPCNCCEGVEPLTPAVLDNQPGLSALVYRVGTHGQFKAAMQAALAGQATLHKLQTREDDDHAIALIDAWATVLDVLTFYQERIANEGFLRTATERRSVLELARAIGYELNPGVAASAYLAFTLDSASSSPQSVTIDIGARVQSQPGPGELPQTFETMEKIEARPAWNELKPRMTQPQHLLIQALTLYLVDVNTKAAQLYLSNTQADVKTGDLILVTIQDGDNLAALQSRVQHAVEDKGRADRLKRTRVDFNMSNKPVMPGFTVPNLTPGVIPEQVVEFSLENVQNYIIGKQWSESDLSVFLSKNQWKSSDVLDYVSQLATTVPGQTVYIFRERAGIFGNNAPYFQSLVKGDKGTLFDNSKDWDGQNGWQIWNDWPDNDPYQPDADGADIFLDRPLPNLTADGDDSWCVLESPTRKYQIYRLTAVNERSLTGFGMSAKVTGLTLGAIDKGDPDKSQDFRVRATTVYVRSEKLDLADLPILEPVQAGDTNLMLDRMVLGLKAGRAVIFKGEDPKLTGVKRVEVVTLKDIQHVGGFTMLEFQTQLKYSYARDSLTIYANVALATHGETKTQALMTTALDMQPWKLGANGEAKSQALGSGDASQAFQQFSLNESPLTYTASSSSKGADSSLKIHINDLEWSEVPSLFGLGPRDHKYAVRFGNDGKARVEFGDGRFGARPATGVANILASYRIGTGLAGLVKADQLTLLVSRPLGVKAVTNPLAADGAADPEKLEDARANAPFTVLTLDRIVSLEDFADFARAFAGIGKAQATWLWDGEKRIVHITIAAANGDIVSETSNLFINLHDAVDAARDPIQPVIIQSYQPLSFNVEAKVLIETSYDKEKVKAAARSALQTAFAFNLRSFGQGVTKSEVIAAIQAVEGVQAVDLVKLYVGQIADLKEHLPAHVAHWDTSVQPAIIKSAELLTINPIGSQLNDMTLT